MNANRSDKPTCSRCGLETEGHLGDVIICDDCYVIGCSCCAEFEQEE